MNSNIDIKRSVIDIRDIVRGRFVLTDDNVYKIYPTLFSTAARVFIATHGEDYKTLGNISRILSDMALMRLDRNSTIVTVGGGVIGDLGGFAAAIYMRGINWINVPTTLLAQLDSCIGGKTGVDLMGYKNMVGAFHMPKEVYIRTDFMRTLPQREILCGLGEALKTAQLSPEARRAWNVLPGNKMGCDYSELAKACALFKEQVTSEDFRESGKRKILNLGHTVGHALEFLDKHRLSHGEYVAVGLAAEAGIGARLGKINKYTAECIMNEARIVSRNIDRLLSAYGGAEIAGAALADKKNSGGKISVMLAEDYVTSEIYLTKAELAKEFDEWKSSL